MHTRLRTTKTAKEVNQAHLALAAADAVARAPGATVPQLRVALGRCLRERTALTALTPVRAGEAHLYTKGELDLLALAVKLEAVLLGRLVTTKAA
jgi:hypothetical protein